VKPLVIPKLAEMPLIDHLWRSINQTAAWPWQLVDRLPELPLG